jgi:hypothetical protein
MVDAVKTGIRTYVITVDEATNTVLKTQEEDPNSGHRIEVVNLDLKTQAAPHVATGVPAGFVPSAIIWVGGPAGTVVTQGGQESATVRGLATIVPSPTSISPSPPTTPPAPKPPPAQAW